MKYEVGVFRYVVHMTRDDHFLLVPDLVVAELKLI